MNRMTFMPSPPTMFLTAPRGMTMPRSSLKDRRSGVLPQSGLPATLAARHLPAGAWLAPGFIDLQVNGGGDVLFNNSPTAETIETIAAAHRKYGTTAFLPTFITDTREKMRAALAAVQEVAETDPSVLGIHLEGPFLSPEKRACMIPT